MPWRTLSGPAEDNSHVSLGDTLQWSPHSACIEKKHLRRLEGGILSSAQLKILRQHPLESKKIIEGFGDSFAWIGKIVVQIHERWDGSGYPYGLKGRQLHELAGILGLADAYEAMVHPRPDRKAQPLYKTP